MQAQLEARDDEEDDEYSWTRWEVHQRLGIAGHAELSMDMNGYERINYMINYDKLRETPCSIISIFIQQVINCDELVVSYVQKADLCGTSWQDEGEDAITLQPKSDIMEVTQTVVVTMSRGPMAVAIFIQVERQETMLRQCLVLLNLFDLFDLFESMYCGAQHMLVAAGPRRGWPGRGPNSLGTGGTRRKATQILH